MKIKLDQDKVQYFDTEFGIEITIKKGNDIIFYQSDFNSWDRIFGEENVIAKEEYKSLPAHYKFDSIMSLFEKGIS